jgi:TfoX/Sxy family transcriptional regulator of competence genes
MAYDHKLLERIRAILAERRDVLEKRMFGGVAFMVGGRMACGPHGDRLIVRIGEEAARRHVGEPHVKPMDFTGKVMKSFATIEPDGLRTAAQLRKWVLMSAEFASCDPVDGKTRQRRRSRSKAGVRTSKSRNSSGTSKAGLRPD